MQVGHIEWECFSSNKIVVVYAEHCRKFKTYDQKYNHVSLKSYFGIAN